MAKNNKATATSKKSAKGGTQRRPSTEPVEDQEDQETMEAGADDSDTPAEPPAVADKPAPRKRGRPKGVKVGPRPVVWICSEVVEDELISDRFSAPETSQERDKFSEQDAKNAFEEKYGVEPSAVQGPFYEVQGVKSSATPRKRQTLSIDADEIRFGTERRTAVYNGWVGQAFDLIDRPDAVFFIPSHQANVADDAKKKAPPAQPVLRSAIQTV